jgi:tRNA(fMet)-specific endonuclease VapC
VAVLVDTSVFIAFERRGMLSVPPDLEGMPPDERVAISAITASELLAGVHLSKPAERQARREAYVERVLAGVAVIPFDLAAARVHAGLVAELKRVGSSIGANDLQIAATSLTHGYAVLTANAREFRRVPGLQVRSLALP